MLERIKELDSKYLIMKEAINSTDAIAWGRKYLIALSVDFIVRGFKRSGIILIRLTSSPNQAVSQELADSATIVPKLRVERNVITKGFINI